jgi:phage shock protein A
MVVEEEELQAKVKELEARLERIERRHQKRKVKRKCREKGHKFEPRVPGVSRQGTSCLRPGCGFDFYD